MIIGNGDHRYKLVENWGLGPEGKPFGGVLPSVAADSHDRVYIVRRAPPAILVYDRHGRYLTEWGGDIFTKPHSVWVGGDEVLVTDNDDHTLRSFTLEGELLRTWGTPGQPGAPGEPFNRPTWAVRSNDGGIYVTDGYGQQRVHHYSADGDLLHSWGTEGTGPGEFSLPHGVRVDSRGRVLVLDRCTDSRVELFEPDGTFIEEWKDVAGPNDIFIDQDDFVYIAEAGNDCVSIWNLDGELLDRLGKRGKELGDFADSLHGLWIDSHGDLYTVEVPYLDNRIQKFERI